MWAKYKKRFAANQLILIITGITKKRDRLPIGQTVSGGRNRIGTYVPDFFYNFMPLRVPSYRNEQ